MRGHEDTAVLLGGRKAEKMIVLVDGSTHGAKAVVTVGQGVGYGKFRKPAGPRRLDNAHIGDVVRRHGVKADAQHIFPFRGCVVRGKNARGEAVFARGLNIHALGAGLFGTAYGVSINDNGIAYEFNHGGRPFC